MDPYKSSFRFDVVRDSDVWQLNALQLFHSLNAIYYASDNADHYVRHLWRSVRSYVHKEHSTFRKREDCLVDGLPTNDLLHMFEVQLNINLDLSFIHFDPVLPEDYVFSRRSPDLHMEYLERLKKSEIQTNGSRS